MHHGMDRLNLIALRCRGILIQGLRKYSYFREYLKEGLDACSIEYDEKLLRNLALRDFLLAKIKAGALLLLFITAPIVAFVVALVILEPFIPMLEAMESSTISLVLYYKNASPDGWLDFLGSALGSVVTLLGLILTIRFERGQAVLSMKKQAQPIIILQGHKRNSQRHTESRKLSCLLDLRSYRFRGLGYECITCLLPDIIIRNVGLNAAINVALRFSFEGVSWYGCSLDYLPPNALESVSVDAEYYKEEIDDIFWDKGYPDGPVMHAYVANACTHLGMDMRERIKYAANKTGDIIIRYNDIYGNSYVQRYMVSLMAVALDNGEMVMYVQYPTLSDEMDG